jgi:hypothetical protein
MISGDYALHGVPTRPREASSQTSTDPPCLCPTVWRRTGDTATLPRAVPPSLQVNTGNVLLSGDLYHYPEEITYKKVPSFDTDREQTAKSRAMIEEFVRQNHAQLWIQHDYSAGIKRKMAPEFYD